MENPAQLEHCYQRFINNLDVLVPDGLIRVDLSFLESEGILYPKQNKNAPSSMNELNGCFQFNVIESKEKVTLFNHKFVVWIAPTNKTNKTNATLAIIAVKHTPLTEKSFIHSSSENLSIELAFITEGIYNSSKIVLTLLEHLLKEIEETHSELKRLMDNSSLKHDKQS